MPPELRARFWVQAITASASGALAILTAFWHDWIEAVFGVDPDHGNGAAEWLAVALLAIIAIGLTAGARREWRHARLSAA
jgi:hypothetical protein